MKHSKKSKPIMLMSIVLLVAVISGAVALGGCIGKANPEVLYKNDKFGFSLQIPQDFVDEVAIKGEGNFIYFVNKEIQTTLPEHIFGVVGRIEIYDKQEFTRENLKELSDAYSLRYLGENEKYYFGWAHATDVQIPPEASEQLKEKYRAMEGEFDEIIKTFKIIDNSATSNLKIEDLLSRIMSSPKESSNPQDYIDAHQEEYEAIIKMDIEALPYLFSEFEKGGQIGLKGHIMESLCRNILGAEDIKYANTDPQDWYYTYRAHMRSILEKNSLEFVKVNYPKGSMVLKGVDVVQDFLKQKDLKVVVNSMAAENIQLPSNFEYVKDGVNVGDLLKQRNELSKQNNLDFSKYMGQKVQMHTAGIETGAPSTNYDVVLFVAEKKVVGFWVDAGMKDPNQNRPDFNVLVNLLISRIVPDKEISSQKLLSFIKTYDKETKMLTFDDIEWVKQTDIKRVNELGLDAELDFPNGYYIHNEYAQENSLKVADDVKVYLVNWSDLANPLLTDATGLTRRMSEYPAPYYLTIKDGVIVEILEQYRP